VGTSTTDETTDEATSSDVAADADASSDEAELTPDGLPVPIGPVLGRTLDDGIHPPEPSRPDQVAECRDTRTLDQVRQALRDMVSQPDRVTSTAVNRTTRPCPGTPAGPDTAAGGLAAAHSPGAPSTDQLLGDTPGSLIWPTLDKLTALCARSTIPVSWSTHLDPRPA
jgi:hypothetical protein